MDLVSILATVILVTTIGTMVVGVGAYAAFKLRDKRKPTKRKKDDTLDSNGIRESIFLTPYVPEAAALPAAEHAGPAEGK
jgi:heme/copper-type cytochrome/quinol oxidase subunit 2